MATGLFYACENDPLVVDVSHVNVELEVKRFDQQLFAYEKITNQEIEELQNTYDPFYSAFVENIINVGAVNDPSVYYYLTSFVNDKNIRLVQQKCDSLYKNFNPFSIELEEAFNHYNYYFPKRTIPKIITYNSGFNYAIVTDSSYLGIGLEMFLGENYPAYQQLGLPQYKIRTMNREHLVASAMLGWMSTEFELQEERADLLTEMVHQGKLLYLLDAMLPLEEDSIKMSYTPEQLIWCDKNEKQVWFYFIDNDLLYSKETKEVIKYMGESPFIQGFPEGSPGRIGHWVGWQIVKAYMNNNKEVTLKKLSQENDAQKILNLSKYKP